MTAHALQVIRHDIGAMVLSGCEVYIVMTGTAGLNGRPLIPAGCVWRFRIIAIVAITAVTDVLWITKITVTLLNIITPEKAIIVAVNDARQVLTMMNFVHHYGQVNGVATVGIGRTRVMAGDTVFHFEAYAAMK